ncbi:hypothetical protein DFJ74DRAFT_654724 [Hyaloraphidium curvatum]|nr:hypothetical protein DFJ74DRAFT_654724 [Hyaloraphidium curvatum]
MGRHRRGSQPEPGLHARNRRTAQVAGYDRLPRAQRDLRLRRCPRGSAGFAHQRGDGADEADVGRCFGARARIHSRRLQQQRLFDLERRSHVAAGHSGSLAGQCTTRSKVSHPEGSHFVAGREGRTRARQGPRDSGASRRYALGFQRKRGHPGPSYASLGFKGHGRDQSQAHRRGSCQTQRRRRPSASGRPGRARPHARGIGSAQPCFPPLLPPPSSGSSLCAALDRGPRHHRLPPPRPLLCPPGRHPHVLHALHRPPSPFAETAGPRPGLPGPVRGGQRQRVGGSAPFRLPTCGAF